MKILCALLSIICFSNAYVGNSYNYYGYGSYPSTYGSYGSYPSTYGSYGLYPSTYGGYGYHSMEDTFLMLCMINPSSCSDGGAYLPLLFNHGGFGGHYGGSQDALLLMCLSDDKPDWCDFKDGNGLLMMSALMGYY